MIFITSNPNAEGLQQRLASYVGVKQQDAIYILSPSNQLKYLYGGSLDSLTVTNIKSFIDDFTNDRLIPNLKSDPEP